VIRIAEADAICCVYNDRARNRTGNIRSGGELTIMADSSMLPYTSINTACDAMSDIVLYELSTRGISRPELLKHLYLGLWATKL